MEFTKEYTRVFVFGLNQRIGSMKDPFETGWVSPEGFYLKILGEHIFWVLKHLGLDDVEAMRRGWLRVGVGYIEAYIPGTSWDAIDRFMGSKDMLWRVDGKVEVEVNVDGGKRQYWVERAYPYLEKSVSDMTRFF